MFGLGKIADSLTTQLSAVLNEQGLADIASQIDLSNLKGIEDILSKMADEGTINAGALSNAFADALSESAGSLSDIAGELLEAAQVEEAETAGSDPSVEAISAEFADDDLDAIQVHSEGGDPGLGASDAAFGLDHGAGDAPELETMAHEAAHVVQHSDSD